MNDGPPKPSVLFVCVHNAGRSQMAAAFMRRAAGDAIEVTSAGSEPWDSLHPRVVEAMMEVGIDLSSEIPRLLENDQVREADVVITMGCGDACPIYPGKRYEDWDLPDPGTGTLEEVRTIRDEIASRVDDLVRELLEKEKEGT